MDMGLSGHGDATGQTHPELARFLRAHREEILRAWRERVGRLVHEGELELLDHIPDLLCTLADVIAYQVDRRQVPPVTRLHAADRLKEGFELPQVVQELSILRDCILQRWHSCEGAPISEIELRVLNLTIDEAIGDSAQRCTDARGRILAALGRLATAAPEAGSLEELLGSLIEGLRKETPAVDVVTILLREDDRLRVKATTGGLGSLREGAALPLDRGFAGVIVAEKRPRHLRELDKEPSPEAEGLELGGVRALYGVPLCVQGKLMGVAYMGSATVDEFSQQDRVLLSSVASRASTAIHQQATISDQVRLREQLSFLVEASSRLTATVEPQAMLDNLADLLVPELADWCVVELPRGWYPLNHAKALAHREPADLPRVADWCTEEGPLGPAAKAVLEGDAAFMALDRSALQSLLAPDDLEQVNSLVILPLKLDERPVGLLTLGQGPSRRQFLKEDVAFLRELGRRLSAVVENAVLHAEAQREVQLREQVLAVVSHDLRNPLGTIELAGTLLLGNPALREDPKSRRQLEIIQRNAQRATRLIADLLDMSSIQAGKLAVERGHCELGSLLQEAFEAWEQVATGKEIELRAESAPAHVIVLCDRERVLQVIGNLVGNAIKFTPAAGSVRVGAEVRDDEVVITVEDTGRGISPTEVERLFEPYWQGTQKGGGAGLGLFITRGIVEAHGGRIWVDSREGIGTAFHFALPRVHAPQDRLRAP